MYTKAGVGMSHHRNPVMAGRVAVRRYADVRARARLSGVK